MEAVLSTRISPNLTQPSHCIMSGAKYSGLPDIVSSLIHSSDGADRLRILRRTYMRPATIQTSVITV